MRAHQARVTLKLFRLSHTRLRLGTAPSKPPRMHFILNHCKCRLNQELRVAIKCSEAAFSDFIAATETHVLEYSGSV